MQANLNLQGFNTSYMSRTHLLFIIPENLFLTSIEEQTLLGSIRINMMNKFLFQPVTEVLISMNRFRIVTLVPSGLITSGEEGITL